MDCCDVTLKILTKDLERARGATGWDLDTDWEGADENLLVEFENGYEFNEIEVAYNGWSAVETLASRKIRFVADHDDTLSVSEGDGKLWSCSADEGKPTVRLDPRTGDPIEADLEKARTVLRIMRELDEALGEAVADV